MLTPGMRGIIQRTAEAFMTQRCTIEQEREARGTFGEPVRVWDVVAVDVPCRLITATDTRRGMTSVIADQEVMEDSYRLIVPYRTPLAVDQRVMVAGATYEVSGILDGRTDAVDVQAVIIRMRDEQ